MKSVAECLCSFANVLICAVKPSYFFPGCPVLLERKGGLGRSKKPGDFCITEQNVDEREFC